MTEIQNYQCPSCGGPLAFDAASSKLKCPYCASSFSPEEIAAAHNHAGSSENESEFGCDFEGGQAEWNTSQLSEEWGQDASVMKEYTCPSCGGTILCEQTTAATSCPYCNNPTVVETQFSGSLHPDYIIPFEIKQKDAVGILKAFYNGKPLLPDTFAGKNRLEEIKGVYVPFWLFDGTASGSAVFSTTKREIIRTADGQKEITHHFKCTREGEVSFKLVPVDASKKMDDDLMDSVEPYHYDKLQPFSTGFLPGFFADIHDVSAEDSFARAHKRCARTCIEAFRGTVEGYDTETLSEAHIKLESGTVFYGLLPVYLLNTLYEGQKYTFAVNGQTGKIVGNLPVSRSKAVALFFKRLLVSFGVGAGIAFAILYFMKSDIQPMLVPGSVVISIISLIIAGVSLASAKSKMRSVATADGAGNYLSGGARISVSKDIFTHDTERIIKTS